MNYTRTEKFFEKLPAIKKPVVDYWSDVDRHESRKWKSESWRGFGEGKCSSVSHLFFSLHLSFLFSPFSKCLKKAGYQTIGKISTLTQPSKTKHVTKKAWQNCHEEADTNGLKFCWISIFFAINISTACLL